MQHLGASDAVRPIYGSLGVKKKHDTKNTSGIYVLTWRL